MLFLVPPFMMPTVTTAWLSRRLSLLLTMVCKVVTISEAATIGSTPFHGRDPCVCLPSTVILKASAEAIIGPGLVQSCPCLALETCIPKIASGFSASKSPSFNINSAPPSSPSGAPSSAG